jgi:hypothetical protein
MLILTNRELVKSRLEITSWLINTLFQIVRHLRTLATKNKSQGKFTKQTLEIEALLFSISLIHRLKEQKTSEFLNVKCVDLLLILCSVES